MESVGVGSGTTIGAGTVGVNDLNFIPSNTKNNLHPPSKSPPVVESQPKRRVSIASELVIEGRGYDNPAFEQNPRRKISQVSN